MSAETKSDEPAGEAPRGLGGVLIEYWMWWALPLILGALVAIAMLWLYEGDATSPFLYPER